MSKHLKSLIIACLVACMTVCLGIFAAACTNNDDEGKLPESVSVTVMLDETTPAVGVTVQLCATGANGLCLEEKKTNEQGVATISIPENLGKDYEVHILKLDTVYDGAYQYVDDDGNPYEKGKGIQIDVTKNSTPKITLKAKPVSTVGTDENPLALTLGTATDFSVKLVEAKDMQTGDKILHWEDNYFATFTTNEAGSYKITVTASLTGDIVNASTTATDYSDYPDFNDNGVGTLKANTEYQINLSALNDYTALVSEGTSSLSYTIKVEYVADGGNVGGDEYAEIVLGQTYECDSTIYKLVVETTGNYTFTVIDEYANLFNLAVAKSLDNIDFGDIEWATDPDTGNPGSSETVELEAGTYYVVGYDMGEFKVTIPQATTD